MARTISCAAVAAALLAVIGTFCAADDYAPTPKPAPQTPGEPVFTDTHLQGGAGQAVNGLQLTLTADRLVLPEKPGALGNPLIIEPTALHLLFTNVSGQPIVLDTYNLTNSRMIMIVVGPDKQTVAVLRRPVKIVSRDPLPIDYPQIEPGNKFVTMEKLQFPGDFNLLFNYALYQPGEYKVQAIYRRPAGAGPAAWEGMVVSNTLTFRIEGPLPTTPSGTTTPEKPPAVPPQPAPTPPPAPPPPTGQPS